MKQNKLALNAVLNTARTILGIIFPIISYPYISRVLGVEGIGAFNFSNSIVSYFLLIAGLGISTYAIREGAQYRDNTSQISKFISEIFSINILSTIISYFLLSILLFFVPFFQNYRLLIIILSIEIIFTTLGVQWVCNIFEDFLFITIRTLIIQVVSLISLFIFIKSEADLYKYIVIVVLAHAGGNIINFFYIRKKYSKFAFTIKCNLKRHIKPILIIFSTSIAVTIYVSSDTTILGFLTSDYQVGLYSTAVKIYTIVKNVLAALLMVLIPSFSILLRTGKKFEAELLFSKVFNMLTLILVPVAVGMFMISGDMITVISGPSYIEASSALKILSIATIFSLFACLYTQCVLIPLEKEAIVFRATFISAIVNMVLNFILIPKWGINAAALTTAIAEFLCFYISYKEAKKTIKLRGIYRNIIYVCIGSVAVMIICYLFRSITSYWIRIVISIGASLFAYSAVMLLLHNEVFIDAVRLVKKR